MAWNLAGNIRGPQGPGGTPANPGGDFYEEYSLNARSFPSGWSHTPVTNTALAGTWGRGVFGGQFYGAVPVTGIYEFGMTALTSATAAGSGRFIGRLSAGPLGTGLVYAAAEQANTGNSWGVYGNLNFSGRKLLQAGDMVYGDFYTVGVFTGVSLTQGTAFIHLIQSVWS